ncbi:Neuronal acetylcholine receptor subunit alpha-7 [Trachymyrmex septentrionalis]|uniref:Neuronal acetylcholine receptor subunit alpha-7 n=1 Tax=Trachymyrmex septentrionalis TaxID=34720 RepID=A0A195FMY8_9HYME|nr:Neuronal acetylcholine receptor subunit alpha-7 [Trachymyrmex septentrionalis]
MNIGKSVSRLDLGLQNSSAMAHQARGLSQLRIKFYNTIVAGLQIVLLLTVLPQGKLAEMHFSIFYESLCGRHEKRLLNHLLANYNTLERPVANESEPLEVRFGITLQQIIDVDEKNQILTTNAWLKLEWTDYNLQWNESEYGGVKDLRITPNKLWKPDILMYNSADEGFDGTYQTNVVVTHNGSCLYVPPGIFKSTCKIDITWFPFDDQHCDMKFGSWTYDGNQLDLVLNSQEGGDLSDFIMNGEWYLIGMPGKKNTLIYQCCPEPYVDVTFTIQIRRRTLYYFFNLIVPCVLISSMALLGFTLPPDSGEKLTLGVTILLSLTVFLNLVAESMPTTSDAVPLIGDAGDFRACGALCVHYVYIIKSLVSFSIPSFLYSSLEAWATTVSGVTILLSLTVFLNLVAETLPQVSDAIPLLGSYFNCIMFMVASSVVLTVLVLNYHHRSPDRYVMPNWTKIVFLQWLPCVLRMSRPGKKITKKTILMTNRMKELELQERSSKSLLANVLDIDDDFRHGNSAANPASGYIRSAYGTPLSTRPATVEETSASLPLSGMQRELHTILKELQFITSRMKKSDEDDEIISDWKFAAMVVDRLDVLNFSCGFSSVVRTWRPTNRWWKIANKEAFILEFEIQVLVSSHGEKTCRLDAGPSIRRTNPLRDCLKLLFVLTIQNFSAQ